MSPRLYDSVQTFSVGQFSTLSDHCPVRVVLTVRVVTENIQETYDFVESSKKLPWSADIAFRFETILQTPEYLSRVENIFSNQNISSQEEVDCMTKTLSNTLVEGATEANNSKSIMLSKMPKKKNNYKKRAFHPKWHDLSCEEALRKVSVSARFLKSNPKDTFLRGRLRQDAKDYRKLVKLRNKQFVENMFLELGSMENTGCFKKKYPLLFCSFLSFQNILKGVFVHFLIAKPL